MKENPLLALKALGQQVWLDNLSRALFRDGALEGFVRDDGVDGVTSNPSIFRKAIADTADYADDRQRLRRSDLTAEGRYEAIVIDDIRTACNLLWPTYLASGGEAGFVSLEVSPALSHDGAGTEAAARHLRLLVSRDNLLVKVPGTPAGIRAFEALTAAGIRVNVTLLFSQPQYEAVAQAYLRGAQRWLESGGHPGRLRSVASLFLSRIDTLVDWRLDAIATGEALALRGRAGVALAKRCYSRYRELFHGPAFSTLAAAGVRPQKLLWASTGGKNPAYSDVLYVEALIGPETITTLPDATLAAFRDHGRVGPTLMLGMDDARIHIEALAALGIKLDEAGETLQFDGLCLFSDAYAMLLESLGPRTA